MHKLSNSELNQWRTASRNSNPAPIQKSIEGYLHDYKKAHRLQFFLSRRVSFELWELVVFMAFVLAAMGILICHIHE